MIAEVKEPIVFVSKDLCYKFDFEVYLVWSSFHKVEFIEKVSNTYFEDVYAHKSFIACDVWLEAIHIRPFLDLIINFCTINIFIERNIRSVTILESQ